MGKLLEFSQVDNEAPPGPVGAEDPAEGGHETTDIALFVRTSDEVLDGWDRQKIVDAMVREALVDQDTAESISLEVEEIILTSSISMVTSPLIRELVDAKLIERGFEVHVAQDAVDSRTEENWRVGLDLMRQGHLFLQVIGHDFGARRSFVGRAAGEQTKEHGPE